MITPKSLFPGARVALVAPASAVPADRLETALERVRRLDRKSTRLNSSHWS